MSKFYEKIIRPILFKMSPETAHELGIEALKIGLNSNFAQEISAKRFASESFGELSRFGLKFKNPLGIAAGFDKNGKVVNQLAALGFGFIEVGTVTFNPQTGNEKPRLFRLPDDKALINRLGFNNEGTKNVVERLKELRRNCVIGVNIGKNKDVPNEEAVQNYLQSFDLAREVADYIAVNVSSPNTPNLRELQNAENLAELLSELQKRNRNASVPPVSNASVPLAVSDASRFRAKNVSAERAHDSSRDDCVTPLLVKIAPDLSDAEIEDVVDISLRHNLSGIIATNTTINRKNIQTKINENGGLSGKPLQIRSNEVISKIYRHSNGKLPIIGVGGIFTAQDAFEKIASGACLIQAYTGFIYQGFTFARDINFGLQKILREKGFQSLDEAIGSSNL